MIKRMFLLITLLVFVFDGPSWAIKAVPSKDAAKQEDQALKSSSENEDRANDRSQTSQKKRLVKEEKEQKRDRFVDEDDDGMNDRVRRKRGVLKKPTDSPKRSSPRRGRR